MAFTKLFMRYAIYAPPGSVACGKLPLRYAEKYANIPRRQSALVSRIKNTFACKMAIDPSYYPNRRWKSTPAILRNR
ncbi:hypothetical protein [Methylomonas albis]|nr:hypothetical protein [Methylomonas albis]